MKKGDGAYPSGENLLVAINFTGLGEIMAPILNEMEK